MGIVLASMCFVVSCASASDISASQFHLESPYQFGAHQHKVQLHAHTTDSDGDHSGQWLMQAYEALGYTAVVKTDHDHSRWTPNLNDPGDHGIIHIPGVEYSGDDDAKSWNHMLGINIKTIHHTHGKGARQAQIDQARKEGGLTFLCHPYDEKAVHRRGWDDADILEMVEGFNGIEILNGSGYIDPDRGRNYPYKVDLALLAGKRTNVIATDDFHRNADSTMDRGFVVINSALDKNEITREAIVSALKSGNYFAAGRTSTSHPEPPRFTDIAVDGRTITVTTDKNTDIEFITARHNYCLEGQPFTQITRNVKQARYAASPEDKFIRIKAVYTEDGNPSYAWSNPIYVIDR
jgi:hypothetical protein